MLMSIGLILAGFLLLMYGGDVLVNGAVAVAKRLDVPPLMIGVVLVGFGTSVPELVTSIEAVLRGSPGISIGNVLGSNIANILLVAGTGAILLPIALPNRGFYRDCSVMLLATLMLVFTCYSGEITRMTGFAYMAILSIYLVYVIYRERRQSQFSKVASKDHEVPHEEGFSLDEAPDSMSKGLLLTLFGIGLTVLGAKVLVEGAVDIARMYGVAETIIGVTIVALGTSLPELATAVVAGLKGESDVSIGNIIGSNIYNIFAILGITAIIKPLPIDPIVLSVDVWVMVVATIGLVVVPIVFKQINRSAGCLFLAGYVAYIGYVYLVMA